VNYQKWISKSNEFKANQKEGSKMNENVFKCSRCKEEKPLSELHHEGACGQYCKDCGKEMREKGAVTRKEKAAQNKGIDRWTGKKIMPSDMPKDGTSHVSLSSQQFLERILTCVRYSSLLAQHVAKVEERERPAREARQKEIKRLKQDAMKDVQTATKRLSEQVQMVMSIKDQCLSKEDRLAMLEDNINKIMQRLGI